MRYAIQYVEGFGHAEKARETIGFLRTQEGYLGGRVLEPVNQVDKNCWRVQAFFESFDHITHNTPLPDGCRLVCLLDGLTHLLAEYTPVKV